jgi:hypothetical protein
MKNILMLPVHFTIGSIAIIICGIISLFEVILNK